MARLIHLSAATKITILVGLMCHHGHHVVYGYSSGAPSDACVQMMPNHGPPPQRDPAPYSIRVSANEILPSGSVTVTISGDDFKGFMATAYTTGFVAPGKMVPLDDTSKAICHNLSITHTGPTMKKEASFEWKAPDKMPTGDGEIYFQVTVVKEMMTFWTEIKTTTPIIFSETPPLQVGGGEGRNGPSTNSPGNVLPPPAVKPVPLPTSPGPQVPGTPQRMTSTNKKENSNKVMNWLGRVWASIIVAVVKFM